MPKKFAGCFVEGVELFIFGAADEDEAAGSDDGAAEIFRAGLRNAARGQFGKFAERHLPENFAFVEVDGIESAQGGLIAGYPFLSRNLK